MSKLADGRGLASITDGRVTMDAGGETSLYLDVEDTTPLSKGERHATLKLTGRDWMTEFELDGAALDALADAVYHAQEVHE